VRVKCQCGNDLFSIHVPPDNVESYQKIVYLICDKCRKVWEIKIGTLPEVDKEGILKE